MKLILFSWSGDSSASRVSFQSQMEKNGTMSKVQFLVSIIILTNYLYIIYYTIYSFIYLFIELNA